MSKRVDLIKARFELNMDRIAGLVQLVVSENIEQLKPSGFGQYEGVGGDLLRFAVVFLHAAFEDLVRTLTARADKSWSLYSASDIEKRLRQSGIDPQEFKSLYPPLTQLAKRRKRIVHDADFLGPAETVVQAWNITDYWQLCMWNLAVVCFYYRLLDDIELGNDAVRLAHDRIVKTMAAWVDFGNEMVAAGKAPTELTVDALIRMADSATAVVSTLKGIRISSSSTSKGKS